MALTDDLLAPARDEALLTAARAVTPAQIERAKAARRTAAALVVRYAPRAPLDVAWEAVIRCAAWLCQTTPGAAPVVPGAQPMGRSALRDSGAMALLSSYRQRRAL